MKYKFKKGIFFSTCEIIEKKKLKNNYVRGLQPPKAPVFEGAYPVSPSAWGLHSEIQDIFNCFKVMVDVSKSGPNIQNYHSSMANLIVLSIRAKV